LDAATGSGLTFLTGEAGLTLYTFEPDSPSTSACTGDCADAWPPLTIGAEDTLEAGDGATGALTTLRRDDGTVQVAYDGAPLYYFAGDTSLGDTNGQGVGDAWFVAEP
jgi:predicted lipoprotein with Yx(FWY)xxD motif